MIKVTVTRRNGMIQSLESTGHANYSEYGQDIVCSAVSSIIFGLWNALDELKLPASYEIESNRIIIRADQPSEITEIVLKTGVIQLETVEHEWKKFIQIKTLEV